MPVPVSLAEVLDAHHEARAEGLHTAMPAKVLSYDPLKQTCSVQPQIKRPLLAENGENVYEELPNIDDVPVMFQRAGDFVFTFPIAKDDFVWIIFSEAPIGEWRVTGEVSEPVDTRRHSMGYPMALPCGYPDTKALLPFSAPLVGCIDAAKMFLGKANGPERMIVGGGTVQIGDGPPGPLGPDFLVKATGLQTILTAIAAWMTAAVTAAAGAVPPIVLPPPPPVVLVPTTVATGV